MIYLSYSFLSSDRFPAMDQAGTSSASSAPLSGTFVGLSLDLRSDKLYDLVQDIPDVMGLRALRPSAAIVKVMSVPDSRCIRVVTPDDHVNIRFHEVLLHDMEDEDLPFVALSELNCLRLDWPKAVDRHDTADYFRSGDRYTVIQLHLGPVIHRYQIISRSGTHAAFRGTYMQRLHAFLEESDATSVRRHHRRCAKELAARMSQSSGRDSADGTADVSTQPTVNRWSVSRAQRPHKLVEGGGGGGGVILRLRNRFACLGRKRSLHKL